ncbi:MAG: MFS transporter [Castellaniella sp.]
MPHTKGSWGELLWGRNGLRSIALAGGIALHAVNVYIVATVLPSVVTDIGGLEYYAWNMTLFVVASIVGSTLTPRAIDSLGLRQAFLWAIAIFIMGTVLCALAANMGWMLVGRTWQGAGGGLLLGLCYAASRILFEERLWPKAMALLSSMWGVATLAGPAIGGIFAQLDAWRWAFWSVIPIAFGLGLMVLTQIARDATPRHAGAQKVPIVQVLIMVAAVVIISAASLSPKSSWNLAGMLAGVLLSAGIAWLDTRSAAHLLPTGAYTLGGGLGSLYACTALLSMSMTMEIFIPYFLQVIQGFTPLMAGYFMVLISAGWSTGSIISAARSARTANRLMRLGPAWCTLAIIGLAVVLPARTDAANALSGWGIALLLFCMGLGIGVTWPHLLTQVFRVAPAGQENMASSAIITVQLYALAFGAALGGMITNASGLVDPGGVAGTRSAALALLVGLALAPGLATVLIQAIVRERQKPATGG